MLWDGWLALLVPVEYICLELARLPNLYPVAKSTPLVVPKHALVVFRLQCLAGDGLSEEVDLVGLVLNRLLDLELF